MSLRCSSPPLPYRKSTSTSTAQEENDNHHPAPHLTLNASSYATFTDPAAGLVAQARLSYAGTNYPTAREQGEEHPLAAFSIPVNNTASAGAPFAARAMPPKRASPGSDTAATPTTATQNKRVKVERSDEFSEAVKRRLHGATRTGQACDRCKIRKIRCDGLAGGCSPCLQNHTECCTTDRITGRATSRGYVEDLESQLSSMRLRVQELEQQLGRRSSGDIKTPNGDSNGTSNREHHNPSQQPQWNSASSMYTLQASSAELNGQQDANTHRYPPAAGSGRVGANHLGVWPGNPRLSGITGTTLSILGMEIDIADFESEDIDEPDTSIFHPRLYNKSYQSFLQSALNINLRIERIDLPPKDEGMKFVALYFQVFHPFIPVLHEPTFMRLINQYYDDPNFRPSTVQTVLINLVFAIMFFQYAARNWESTETQASFTTKSNLHYHYAASMLYQLACSHTFEDVQALTLLCAHLRSFSKPGASWMMTRFTLSIAVELGMHRSTTKPTGGTTPNLLEVELKKRSFWLLLMFDASLSGKLGRPSALGLNDFDVELPEEWDDELLSEKGLDTSRPGHCRFKVGLHAIRLVPHFIELWKTLYAVRRQPETYIATVNRLESCVQIWRESEPAEFTNAGSVDDNEGQLFHHYVQAWGYEFQLLLRHPSVSMTTDAAFNTESLGICVASSRKLLGSVRQLQKLRSLDTTWYNSAVYVMAITTTLFAQWEKRDETSLSDLTNLKEEMDIWLEIMGDCGRLLGAGDRLRQAVKVVTESTLALLNRCFASRTTKSINGEGGETNSSRLSTSHTNAYAVRRHSFSFQNGDATNPNASSSNYLAPEVSTAHQATPYPTATQYSSFYDNLPPVVMPFNPRNVNNYTTFPTTTDVAFTGYGAEAAQSQASNWRPNDPYPLPHLGIEYAGTLAGSADLQSNYTANALIQLGGRDGNVNDNLSLSVNSLSQHALNQLTALQSVSMAPPIGTLRGQMSMDSENIWPKVLLQDSGLGEPTS